MKKIAEQIGGAIIEMALYLPLITLIGILTLFFSV